MACGRLPRAGSVQTRRSRLRAARPGTAPGSEALGRMAAVQRRATEPTDAAWPAAGAGAREPAVGSAWAMAQGPGQEGAPGQGPQRAEARAAQRPAEAPAEWRA